MKRLLLAGTILGAIGATPALAADTAIILWNTSDPLGFESATGTGSAAIATSNLDGVTVTLSTVNRSTNPNQLTEGNILITNTDATAQTLKIIVGANGYTPGASEFQLTGTIGVISGGADLGVQYAVDSANTLNGLNETLVGAQINAFDSGALTGPFSFSDNLTGIDNVLGPYGMAEELTLVLQPGASIFVQGASMTASAVPEPSTWAMMLGGFGLMGLLGWHKSRGQRLATL